MPSAAAGPRGHDGAFAPVSGTPGDAEELQRADLERCGDARFRQHVNATDALRTGTYSKTLTFTLTTTNP